MTTTDLNNFYINTLGLSDPEVIDILLKLSIVQNIKKDEYIIRQGTTQGYLAFLVDGIVRSVCNEGTDIEFIDSFISTPGTPLSSMSALETYRDSLAPDATLSIIAVTDCTIVNVPLITMSMLVQEKPDAMQMQIRLLETSLLKQYKLKHMLYMKTPQERYDWFCDHFPSIVDSISRDKVLKKHIASFLNFAPQLIGKLERNHKSNTAD